MKTTTKPSTQPEPVTLENWSLVEAGRKMSLRGAAFGDPMRRDGTQTLTAVIQKIQKPFVTTSNGVKYKLGAPDTVWANEYPGCVDRFWAAADRI